MASAKPSSADLALPRIFSASGRVESWPTLPLRPRAAGRDSWCYRHDCLLPATWARSVPAPGPALPLATVDGALPLPCAFLANLLFRSRSLPRLRDRAQNAQAIRRSTGLDDELRTSKSPKSDGRPWIPKA